MEPIKRNQNLDQKIGQMKLTEWKGFIANKTQLKSLLKRVNSKYVRRVSHKETGKEKFRNMDWGGGRDIGDALRRFHINVVRVPEAKV